MSAYMVLPTQQSVLASLALRFNREDVLTWIEVQPKTSLSFEAESERLVSCLNKESSDLDIIKALTTLFSASNFQSILDHYGLEVAIDMACLEEEIAEIKDQANGDTTLEAKLALDKYINNAIEDLNREAVKALIDTTNQYQYQMWFANLRYQTCELKDFAESAFEKFFKFVFVEIDIGKPGFSDCEWSLDQI